MSYSLFVIADMPIHYWRARETTGTTATNIVAIGKDGTYIGTPTPTLNHRSLVSGGGASARFDGSGRISATVGGFAVQGLEAQAFAMECWINTAGVPAGNRTIMGRENARLRMTTGGIEFIVRSTDGTDYTAYYSVTDWTVPLHIVGNYVGGNLGLMVNAQEGTNADLVGQFANTSDIIYLGGGSTSVTAGFRASEFAVYNRSLSIQTVSRHYDLGRATISPSNMASIFGATYYALDDTTADVAFEYVEGNEGQFLEGTYSDGVSVSDGRVYGVGTHTSDLQYVGNLENIAGSRIDWNGTANLTVDISFDKGTTWTACVNHAEVPGLGPNASLANKFFILRKTFTGTANTLTAAGAMLETLSLRVYQSKTMNSNEGGNAAGVYGSPTLSPESFSPLVSERMGTKLDANSHLVLPATPTKSIEFWIRPDEATPGAAQYFFDNRNAGNTLGGHIAIDAAGVLNISGFTSTWVNGVPRALTIADLTVGTWLHFGGTFASTTSTPIFLNARNSGLERGRASYSHISIYSTTLDNRLSSLHYRMFLNNATESIPNETTPSIVEHPTGVKAYSFAWTTVQNALT